MKMEPRISKICMSLEELETIVQIKNPVDNDNVESVGRYRVCIHVSGGGIVSLDCMFHSSKCSPVNTDCF